MLRISKVVLVSVGLTLALSACSAEADVAPAPAIPSTSSTPDSEQSTPPPVATPTSVATVQAREPTFTPIGTFNENDALAFGQFYIQLINHARVTGDPSLLDRYSLPGCNTCTVIARGTDNFRNEGLRYLQPEMTFESASLAYYSAEEQRAEVDVQVSGDLGQMVRPDGAVIYEPEPREHIIVPVQMEFVDGGWKLFEVL